MRLSERAREVVMNAKCARIIECLSAEHGLTLDEATDMFYSSVTCDLINEGVAELHCRSDRYLSDEVWLEMLRK